MAISFVAAAQAADPSNGTVTCTKPTGTTTNDVIIAFLAQNEQTVTLPSGFTLIAENSGSTDTFSGHAYYKVCGGSEPADYTFSVGTSGAPMAVVLTTWRGLDTSNPVNASSNTNNNGGAEPMAGPTVTTTQTTRRLFGRMTRSTTALPTCTTATSGWTERGDTAEFSGGTVRYGTHVYSRDADDSSGAGQATATTTLSTTETSNVFVHVALQQAPVNASAGAVSATAAAYDPSTIITTTSGFAAATVTAYDAVGLPGVLTNAGAAGAVVTAYDAAGWVIHPVNVGVQAFDATVAITTTAEHATASVAVNGGTGYFGAPASRTWRIAAENRRWTIAAESRVYRIPSED